MFWVFKKTSWKTPILVQKGDRNKSFFFGGGGGGGGCFFFAKCEKLSFLSGPCFGQFLVDVQNHYKNRYFSTFAKQKTNMTSPKGLPQGPSKGWLRGQVWCNIKMPTWPLSKPFKFACATFCFKKKG